MKANAYGLSEIGSVRKKNEDYYLIDAELSLYVVCDGVGGSRGGEVAAEICAHTFRDYIKNGYNIVNNYNKAPNHANREAVSALVQKGLQAANSKVMEIAAGDEKLHGMCTTADAMLLTVDHAILGHVGDSRIYLCRDNRVHQLTQDHQVSAEMQKQGIWTEEDAAQSGYSNVLTRAIGGQPYVQPDTLLIELAKGDVFLLCTDGLSGTFKGDELAEYGKKTEFAQLPGELVKFALDRGSRDNITAIVVRMEDQVQMPNAVDALRKSEILGKVPLFRYLTYSELMQVLALVQLKEFAPQSVMIQEGSPGDEMFILLSGSVDVVKGKQVIASRSKGGIFGDMSLFENAPRSASIVTTQKSLAMVIGRKDLLALFRRDSQISVKFLWSLNQELSARLRSTSHELAEAKRAGSDAETSEHPFTLPDR